MNNENQELVYCADADEYKVYSEICDKLCIEWYCKNHFQSGTHTNNFYKRQVSIIFNSSLTEPKQ